MDLEILQAAFPEEVTTTTTTDEGCDDDCNFPIPFTLHLSTTSRIVMEFPSSYPNKGIQIVSYRSKDKRRMERTLSKIRRVSLECQEEEIEGGIMCCSIGLETWNNHHQEENTTSSSTATKSDESQQVWQAVVEFHHMLIGKSHKKEAAALSAAEGVIRGWIFMGGPSRAVVQASSNEDLRWWLQECKRAGKPGEIRYWRRLDIYDSDNTAHKMVPNKLKAMGYSGKDAKMDLLMYQQTLAQLNIASPFPAECSLLP